MKLAFGLIGVFAVGSFFGLLAGYSDKKSSLVPKDQLITYTYDQQNSSFHYGTVLITNLAAMTTPAVNAFLTRVHMNTNIVPGSVHIVNITPLY